MPASLNQDHGRVRSQTRHEVEAPPIPLFVPKVLAVRVGAGAGRIVNDRQVRAPARDATDDARGEVFAALRGLPPPRRAAVPRYADVENGRIRRQEIADATAPLLCQFLRMRGADQAGVRSLRQIPRRKENTRVGAFGRSWREKDAKPVTLAPCNRLQRLDDQEMMRSRLKPADATKFS